ncbi:aldehyde dehydrogenase [Mycobacterium sp. DSM 3803]|nr:aldehyde dehydrogenase [Mycobacterium sp. DSM 3803]
MTTLSEASAVETLRMLIGGSWVDAKDERRTDSVNPFTGEVWATAPFAGAADVDAAVRAARSAFDGPWGSMTGADRAKMLLRFADLLERRAEELAVIESTDNGKLIREMGAQMKALPGYYRYFAGYADKIHGETIPTEKPNFFTYTTREPLGVVGAILPWNSPLLLLTWKLAPALAAGCTVVAKAADQTPASVLRFGALFEEAGFPPGVFNVVTGDGPTTGAALVRHPEVDRICFTGSNATGIQVMKNAADNITRVTLELGGKSPNIVFADADLDAVTNGVLAGIFAATGQTCVAGSRLLVQRDIYDGLARRLVERAKDIRLGDPLDPASEMGPVAFRAQLDKILEYVRVGQAEGAVLATGGDRPTAPELGNGLFVSPTIFTGVDNTMRIAQEEIFGPVLCMIPFDTEEDAVRIANATPFGLGAGVWTLNVQRAHRMARALRAGTVWVNAYRTLSWAAPFGGFKGSGIGRELGLDSLHEFTETKSVWIETSGASQDPFRMG